jgi:hypothetical protein
MTQYLAPVWAWSIPFRPLSRAGISLLETACPNLAVVFLACAVR